MFDPIKYMYQRHIRIYILIDSIVRIVSNFVAEIEQGDPNLGKKKKKTINTITYEIITNILDCT